jgi:hypothetical protein
MPMSTAPPGHWHQYGAAARAVPNRIGFPWSDGWYPPSILIIATDPPANVIATRAGKTFGSTARPTGSSVGMGRSSINVKLPELYV